MKDRIFKRTFFAFIILLFPVVPTFAEERGSAIGTFGVGFLNYDSTRTNFQEPEIVSTLAFDLYLISKKGLAISIGKAVSHPTTWSFFNSPYIGIGYRYLADKWDLGLSFFRVTGKEVDTVKINYRLNGVKINGSYWMTNNFGLTLTAMLGRGRADFDGATFGILRRTGFSSVRAGMSVRL